MGKKSQKRSSQGASIDDLNGNAKPNTAATGKSSRRTKDQSTDNRKTVTQSNNDTNNSRHQQQQHQQHQQQQSSISTFSSVPPVKILNPFYIETPAPTASQSNHDQRHHDEYYEDDSNQEQFGLLDYEDYRNDTDDFKDGDDTNQSYAYTQRQQQQIQIQRSKQFLFERNIRICLIFTVTILITWLMVSILNSSEDHTTLMTQQNHSSIIPTSSMKQTMHPLMAIYSRPTSSPTITVPIITTPQPPPLFDSKLKTATTQKQTPHVSNTSSPTSEDIRLPNPVVVTEPPSSHPLQI